MYWLLGRNSQLTDKQNTTIQNYIKIWTYDIQFWGVATNSNIKIRYQSRVLEIITNVLWYVTNGTLHCNLKIPTIKEIIKEFCQKYCGRLEEHLNNFAANLMKARRIVRKLKRKEPTDLPNYQSTIYTIIFHS